MGDQASTQTLLAAAVPGLIVESAPTIDTLDGTTYPPPPPFALVGHWLDDYGGGLTFTANDVISITPWGVDLVTIVEYTDTYYVAQKAATDSYNPKKFQKVFFHSNEDGTFSTCTSLRDGDTEEEAIAHDGVGIYYKNTTQCGSFSHSVLSPFTIPVAGAWIAGQANLTINNDQWKSVAPWGTSDRPIFAFGGKVAIAQVPADDTYNPSKWIRFEWHDKTASGFSYCSTVYNADTLLDALKYDSVGLGHYNTSDPKGCGANNFAHSAAFKA